MPESIIEIPPRPTVTRLPDPPSSADPNSFDPRADDYLDAQYQYSEELNVLAGWMEDVSAVVRTLAQGTADDAASVAQAVETVGALERSAEQSATTAKAYAQAAGAAGGIPPAEEGKFLGGVAQGQADWIPLPKDASKLDKQGGVATALGYSYNDLGTIAAAGTAAVNVQTAAVQRIQAGGNITLTIAGWATDGRSEDLELHCVNFGGKTITWPAGNWIKSDGSFATAVGNAGVTWQTAGTDRVLVMRDAGVLYFKVMR